MSYEYDLYLERHRANVRRGFAWLRGNLPDVLEKAENPEWYIYSEHDASKSDSAEYSAYDAYFYGGNRSYAVVQDFKEAWLHHIHNNPHHWQYWVLINDEPDEGQIALKMPYHYILEMICDWWSFSWSYGNPTEIFKWYEEHRDYMLLHANTRKTVEDILSRIADKLDETGELCHHGIKGQKWGVRNGPPYPLNKNEKASASEKTKVVSQEVTKIAEEKFTKYALDPERSPDKSRAFREALGYTRNNCQPLIDDIKQHIDINKFVEKGDRGFGMRYQQVMRLKGPNGKEANVLTAWVKEDDGFRLTSVYVTEKEESK